MAYDIKLFKNDDGTFQYVENSQGNWKPWGESMYEMPSEDEYERVKKLNQELSHTTRPPDPVSLSPEAYSKIYGEETLDVGDAFLRNLGNLWYGVKQITGNTTPEEDAAWAEREQRESNLTPWGSAIGAFGSEVLGANLVTQVPRQLLKQASKQMIKRQAATPGRPITKLEESVKSLSDQVERRGGIRLPFGTGPTIAGAGAGAAQPLTPEQMEDEWANRGKNAMTGAVATKTGDLIMSGGGTLRNFQNARKFDQQLSGSLPYPIQFPKHLATLDPVEKIRWEEARRGTYGPTAQAAVNSAERRMNINIDNNVKTFQNAFRNDPKARQSMKFKDEGGREIPYTTEVGGNWERPMAEMREQANTLKQKGKDLYKESEDLGRITTPTHQVRSQFKQMNERLFDSDKGGTWVVEDLPNPVKGVLKELDKLSKSGDVIDTRRLMGLHRKLNDSYRSASEEGAERINAQITRLKKEIDHMIDNVDIEGNENAIGKWREGRQVYTEWNNKYMDDPITRMALDENITPSFFAQKLFPRHWDKAISMKERLPGIENLLNVYPEWKPYLKQDAFNAMISRSDNAIDSQDFMDRFNKYFHSGEMRPIAEAVYSPEEMERLNDLYGALKRKNASFSDKDFKAETAPGPVATMFGEEIPDPWSVNNMMNRRQKLTNTVATLRARGGDVPRGRGYTLPALSAQEELQAALGMSEEGKEDRNKAAKDLVLWYFDAINDLD